LNKTLVKFLAATSARHFGQRICADNSRTCWPAAFASAPLFNSSSTVAASAALVASISGDDSAAGCAFRIRIRFVIQQELDYGRLPCRRAAIIRAVRMSLERALTSAP